MHHLFHLPTAPIGHVLSINTLAILYIHFISSYILLTITDVSTKSTDNEYFEVVEHHQYTIAWKELLNNIIKMKTPITPTQLQMTKNFNGKTKNCFK